MNKSATSPVGMKSYKEWSRDDLLACIFSPLAYFAITAGIPLILLNQWTGWLLTIFGLGCAAAMFYIIDPKLKFISAEYEKKQKAYLAELDDIVEWKTKPDPES